VSIERIVDRDGRPRWKVRWYPDGRDGPRRARFFDDQTDALEFEVRMRRQRQLGAHAPAEPSGRRFGEFVERDWWPFHPHSQNTHRVWKSLLNLWILPYLGNVRFRDLGADRILEWRRQILREGCSQIQANRALTVLSAALGDAKAQRLLAKNPVREAEITRAEPDPARPRVLAPDEAERLRRAMLEPVERRFGRGGRGLRVAPNASAPWDALLVSVLCYAGPRPDEALHLDWRGIGYTLVVDPRKVRGRRRTVELVEPLREELEALRPRRVRGDELVFANQSGAAWNLNNWRKRVWQPAVERAGIAPCTPYDGRHTFASLLIHEGRSLPYVAAAMGSSAQTVLKHYTHLFDEARLAPRVSMLEAIRAARVDLCSPNVDPYGVVGVLHAAPLSR